MDFDFQNILPYFVLITLISVDVSARKKGILKSSEDLLTKEQQRLQADRIKCSLTRVSVEELNRLRIQQQLQGAVACHVEFLKNNIDNSWVWSSLGDVYQQLNNKKFNSLAANSFKQAAKLGGKTSPQVPVWHILSPFVIGKYEFDGDPVAAYGGIWNVSKKRLDRDQKFITELIPGSEITWQVAPPTGQHVQVMPTVDWGDLVNSLGSTGITEWQGWAVGEFAINDNNVNVKLQCLGMPTFYIDHTQMAGEVYMRDKFWFTTDLSRGIHTVYVHLRAKVKAVFQFSIKTLGSNFEILPPPFLPDLYAGHLFGRYLSIPIANLHPTSWLKIIRVFIQAQNGQHPLNIGILGSDAFSIAPGQTRPLNLVISSDSSKVVAKCNDLQLKVKVVSSEGHYVYPLVLRCRKAEESVIFTFLDHDGSIQHGAVIHPLEKCPNDLCPTLLTLHGTTVPAQNQADSYKHMVNGKFVFGLEKAWVLAPTRHGAHNWEGPGALTAMTALHEMSELLQQSDWITQKASTDHIIFAGHSMGGHGSWHLATHFPDQALAVVSLAGWIKKEEYSDSNLFYRHDIANSYTDPIVRGILESCVAENDVDKLVSNLKGVPVMTRIGGADRTIHPWLVRRMYRVLKEHGVPATYVEIPGKEHWWWDTKETNDGGAVNDKQLRDFTNNHAEIPSLRGSCSDDGCEEGSSKYTSPGHLTEEFTVTSMNPAFGGAVRGIRILQQTVPFRTSLLQVTIKEDQVQIDTTNVDRFSVQEPLIRPVDWAHKSIKVDSSMVPNAKALLDDTSTVCRKNGEWAICTDNYEDTSRGPSTLGPARRVVESQFLIVIGTQGNSASTNVLQEAAVYIANQFLLTSDTLAPVVKDTGLTGDVADKYNLIILGGPECNKMTAGYLDKILVDKTDAGFRLGSCSYHHPRTGLLTLAPHGNRRLALLLMGNGIQGLQDVVSMATPTIPPMARSPFSNMIPDFVITGPHFRARGTGGYLCTGFWDNHWNAQPSLMSCGHCLIK